MTPKLLILETSGRSGVVALAEGAVLRRSRVLDEARRHARDLAPAVGELLAAEGWTPRELQAVVVSRGPGSYTGLRVGIMSAKTLAYATGCALIGIDTFAAIALQAPADAERVDVLADAQQDNIYVQRFERGVATELAIRPFAEWLAQRSGDAWVTGPGLVKLRDRLPSAMRVVAAEQWNPTAESLLRLGLARYDAGERDDAWKLEPLYFRPSSAEQKWTALGK